MIGYKSITIERGGKKPQKYALIKYVDNNMYIAVRDNGGDRPRVMFFLQLTKEEMLEAN